MLAMRPYESDDWHEIAEIHDAARLMELRLTVGEEAFLSLAETAENEGLFSGELWVATDDDRVVGFVAVREDEVARYSRMRSTAAGPPHVPRLS